MDQADEFVASLLIVRQDARLRSSTTIFRLSQNGETRTAIF